MMSLEQRLAVYRLAVTGSGYGDVVELGAWIGLTTTYLATACRVRGEGIVHAVDTFEGTKEYDTRYPSVARYDGNTLQAFRDQIKCAGVDDLVKPHVGLTNEVVREYRGCPIRFLLIDADHSYEGVRADFRLWSPLVMPGGLVVFDDYLMPEVARFVDEEVGADRRFEIAPGRIVPNLMAVTKKPVLAAASQPGLRRSPAAEVVEGWCSYRGSSAGRTARGNPDSSFSGLPFAVSVSPVAVAKAGALRPRGRGQHQQYPHAGILLADVRAAG
jgi:predicted O-methyltransferase YrrM